ncbi:MAG TPA: Zn-dependent hydrolase [Methylophilaceae bacterium]|nr:Zn-dependent hydrolase [Methylophilaceae bacterium]
MFKQLFDSESSTLTYLIVDDQSREAAFIDPVDRHADDYMKLTKALDLKLKYALETHVHADHITASGVLRQKLGLQTAVGQQCGAVNADIQLNHGDQLQLGLQTIAVIATPGHTAGSVSFLWQDKVFTGDALLINGCGRTDFQSGNAGTLYDSITQKLFDLPEETLVYPGHDYNGKRVSSIGQEKISNQRLAGKSRDEFIALMQQLNLPQPKMIDIAVPANRKCGVYEEDMLQG